jgi:hypothetical protein
VLTAGRELVGTPDAEPLGVDEAAGCEVVSRDPGEDGEVEPLDGEPNPDPSGGVLTGGACTGSEGVLTVGVVMPGVVTWGVVICGVVICGVVIGPAVIVGPVTVGTVADGTLAVGFDAVGTDAVGTGDDAEAGTAPTTSAPTVARTASTARAGASRVAPTRHHLLLGLCTNDGADIAHRPRSRPVIDRNYRIPELTPARPGAIRPGVGALGAALDRCRRRRGGRPSARASSVVSIAPSGNLDIRRAIPVRTGARAGSLSTPEAAASILNFSRPFGSA